MEFAKLRLEIIFSYFIEKCSVQK